jgi:transcriptional regulator with XRE-family HTH domain
MNNTANLEILRERRIELGLTMEELAGRLNSSTSTIARFEKNPYAARWSTVQKIASELKVQISLIKED